MAQWKTTGLKKYILESLLCIFLLYLFQVSYLKALALGFLMHRTGVYSPTCSSDVPEP